MLTSASRVADGDRVHRRFDPSNKSHWTADEGDPGQGRLRSGAFRWDSEPASATTAEHAGCSVYQQSKILSLGLSLRTCVDLPGWRLASIDPAEVRSLSRANLPNISSPFDVIQTPYPQGETGAPLRDAAHADICHEKPSRGISGWYSALAKQFSLSQGV